RELVGEVVRSQSQLMSNLVLAVTLLDQPQRRDYEISVLHAGPAPLQLCQPVLCFAARVGFRRDLSGLRAVQLMSERVSEVSALALLVQHSVANSDGEVAGQVLDSRTCPCPFDDPAKGDRRSVSGVGPCGRRHQAGRDLRSQAEHLLDKTSLIDRA